MAKSNTLVYYLAKRPSLELEHICSSDTFSIILRNKQTKPPKNKQTNKEKKGGKKDKQKKATKKPKQPRECLQFGCLFVNM